ncbi:uncharacterized protein BDW43DRAFT_77874 [Aspergillus alliaceus]|uniref:uncharacterized protein n=1 Tax=Petromyces alliaceus TaxID=209559 RepID=UPI0012A5E743|nr:uncharacterized protein BDW43DRAFT_77874 [Aspergillus alliaceus]KAB8233770.1 hypothetical protein BDW43DRAFT_77874 [Aspergillus alliaceus]
MAYTELLINPECQNAGSQRHRRSINASLYPYKLVRSLLKRHSSTLAGMLEQIGRTEVMISLLHASRHLHCGRDRESESHVSQAMQRTLQLTQSNFRDPLIAHCKFWLGRIEWFRGDEAKAYQLFLETEQWHKDFPEGEEVPLYLEYLQPDAEKETRRRALCATYPFSLLPPHHRRYPAYRFQLGTSDRKLPSKRSHHDELCETEALVTVRPKSGERSKDPKVWIEIGTKSLPPQYCGSPRRVLPIRRKHQNWDTAWLQNSRFRPPQGQFTFTMYPTGIASRTRPTNIFPEQIYECVVPEEKWNSICKRIKGKYITMGFLAYERQQLEKAVLEKTDRILEQIARSSPSTPEGIRAKYLLYHH